MKCKHAAEYALAVVLLGLGVALAVPAAADETRGSALYENHCGECHSARVHDRAQRLPGNLAELKAQVVRWETELNLRWSDEDIADVVDFLNATKYKF